MKKLLLTSLFLTACTAENIILPIETLPKPENKTIIDKITQKGLSSRYLCKQDKEVKIIRIVTNKKSGKKSKKDAINLTFEGITNKLNATLSQTGKSYTNIHWQWFETTNNNMLLNSLGEVLAEQCIKQ